MNKMFYQKLASNNIKKNSKYYLPYMITTIGMVAMFYMISSLADNSINIGSQSMQFMLILGTRVTAVFAVIFLFYTNRFLTKRRTKEFGLYSILGMEKRHISKVIFWETFFVWVIGLGLGLMLGILLDKAMYLALLKLVNFSVTMDFAISVKAIIKSFLLFGMIFLCIFLRGMMEIHTSNPMKLLRGSDVGEKDPKTRHLLGILGIIFLGTGYYISVITRDPVTAIVLFFMAVLLVVVGTYLVFIAGSISLLKLLRKNKAYYYKTSNFISVSGMIYRMKQNAVGLGNICILSTAVLVMLSTTISLYVGMEDIVKARYPREIEIINKSNSGDNLENIRSWADEIIKSEGLSVENKVAYKYLNFTAIEQGGKYETDVGRTEFVKLGTISNLFFITEEDYNKWSNEAPININEDEVMIYSNNTPFPHEKLNLLGLEFNIKGILDNLQGNEAMAAYVTGAHFVVVKDMNIIKNIHQIQNQIYKDEGANISSLYIFDVVGDEKQGISLYKKLVEKQEQLDLKIYIESRDAQKSGIYELYGGFLFVGIFLGALFIIATILIMYYKQISEGYEDKARFEIMQKVGMDKSEIKKSISSQVLIVFFLPLITAGIHILFALPIIIRLLAALQLNNVPLFLTASGICFLVFGIFYTIIYKITAKTYYKIVS